MFPSIAYIGRRMQRIKREKLNKKSTGDRYVSCLQRDLTAKPDRNNFREGLFLAYGFRVQSFMMIKARQNHSTTVEAACGRSLFTPMQARTQSKPRSLDYDLKSHSDLLLPTGYHL